MKIIKKIQAFTLTELIVVLVVSIIIISLAFSALNIINRSFDEYRDRYLDISQKRDLEMRLTVDFHRAQSITFFESENKLVFKKFSNSLQNLEYRFLKDRIIIDSDTLKIPYSGYSLFFDGKNVEGKEIDALKINFSKSDDENFLFVSKFNSSKNFMKDEI